MVYTHHHGVGTIVGSTVGGTAPHGNN
ncbi:uncharacterized protein METZ01_LOCUS303725, partial [marine metagenome]